MVAVAVIMSVVVAVVQATLFLCGFGSGHAPVLVARPATRVLALPCTYDRGAGIIATGALLRLRLFKYLWGCAWCGCGCGAVRRVHVPLAVKLVRCVVQMGCVVGMVIAVV